MNILIFIGVFSIMLFVYLHIVYHLKSSSDLEVYEIELPSKSKLEEICDLRQPVTFRYNNERLLSSCSLINAVDNYSAFDINIRNKENNDTTEMYVPLVLREGIELFQNDKKAQYISMHYEDFLQ